MLMDSVLLVTRFVWGVSSSVRYFIYVLFKPINLSIYIINILRLKISELIDYLSKARMLSEYRCSCSFEFNEYVHLFCILNPITIHLLYVVI